MKHKAGANLKCRECEIAFITKDGFDDEWCPMCGGVGTIVPEKAAQPTAAGGTVHARRLAEGESEASGEEARALTGGLAKLRSALETAASEALLLRRNYEFMASLDTIAMRDFRCLQEELVEWVATVADMERESPAVSDELSNRGRE